MEFRALPVEEVRRADELFVSSSIREILPIVRLDGQQIGDGRPGALTKRLHRAFREKVSEIHGLTTGSGDAPVRP